MQPAVQVPVFIRVLYEYPVVKTRVDIKVNDVPELFDNKKLMFPTGRQEIVVADVGIDTNRYVKPFIFHHLSTFKLAYQAEIARPRAAPAGERGLKVSFNMFEALVQSDMDLDEFTDFLFDIFRRSP